MKVVVYNLGCKVNQYESDGIIQKLEKLGYDVSDELEPADAYVLNTCAVTNEAERKSRQAVARCRKLNENAFIIICGCASQNDSKQFVGKDGVTYISGVAGKDKIPYLLTSNGINIEELPTEYEDKFSPANVRTRAYIKAQDGCNNYCSYCIIPYLRGRSRSRSIESVVEECNQMAEKVKEIVITGINLSAYGTDIGSSLTELIGNLTHIDIRIRLGSLEVNVIDEDFLKTTQKLKKFCPQFHLSLQSGDDNTLKAMNRHYTTDYYLNKVKLIRKYYPLAGITTDLICGFPTETDEEFRNTLNFIDKVKFSDMHIFAYSPRKGTIAARYKELPALLVRSRIDKANEINERNRAEFASLFIGKSVEVLIEENGGYTREYLRVKVDGEKNTIVDFIPKEYISGYLK